LISKLVELTFCDSVSIVGRNLVKSRYLRRIFKAFSQIRRFARTVLIGLFIQYYVDTFPTHKLISFSRTTSVMRCLKQWQQFATFLLT